MRTTARLEKIKRVLNNRQAGFSLVLNNIHDPHNVSAILRSCDAFGVGEVHLFYTNTPFPVLGKKSSASAKKWVRTVRHSTEEELLKAVAEKKMRLVGTAFDETSIPLYDWDFSRPTAVILGNEHSGMSEELAGHTAGTIHIPMLGMVQSLNVSVAAAVILYEACRQRTKAGYFSVPNLDAQSREVLFKEWIEK